MKNQNIEWRLISRFFTSEKADRKRLQSFLPASPQQITNWKTRGCPPALAPKLAEFFNVPVGVFFGEDFHQLKNPSMPREFPNGPTADFEVTNRGEKDPLNTAYKNSESLVKSSPEVRRVDVNYSVELLPGQFAPSQPVLHLKKTIAVAPQEYTPTAFAIIYTGSAMGDILEHQQPIIIDAQTPKPGQLCMLGKDGGFMFCVFESESPFGMVFRLKGTQSRLTAPLDRSYTVYKVISLRNASDIE